MRLQLVLTRIHVEDGYLLFLGEFGQVGSCESLLDTAVWVEKKIVAMCCRLDSCANCSFFDSAAEPRYGSTINFPFMRSWPKPQNFAQTKSYVPGSCAVKSITWSVPLVTFPFSAG